MNVYPQIFGKYVLERELSRGGMARVLLATLRGAGGFEKKLVVKQIRDELAYDNQFVRRFVEEAKTTVALSHPNIVPVYELGVEQGTYFLAMELVEGVSVADLIRERTKTGDRRVLTPEEGAYIGVEVCRALDYAHRRMKVVHRDITPRNVMIDEEGQVKLIDFGIAAPAQVAGHDVLGSPGHMPPEQVDGLELGPPTDLFAVAVLLMEAWTGVAPFRRATPDECDVAMRGPHPVPSHFDPRLLPLDDVVRRAMAIDPKERQQDADELGRAFRTFLQGLDIADVARALGDRVRVLRESLAAELPASGRESNGGRQPSHAELGTQTFAAREEALRWSDPPPPPPVTGSASTRKISEATPVAAAAVLPTPRSRPRPDPSLSIPTPLMIETPFMVEPVGRLLPSAAAKGKESSAAELETIATRPFETPVRDMPAVGVPKPAPSPTSRVRLWLAAAFVAINLTGAVVAWRSRGPAAVAEPTLPPPVASVVVVKPPVSAAPSVSVPVPVVSSAPEPRPSAAAPVSASPSTRATVVLLGDPGTRVTVDGVPRGDCPTRVLLDPGQHDARFVFDATGESRGERFTVKPSEHMTVRAEFTGATPTIRIQRN